MKKRLVLKRILGIIGEYVLSNDKTFQEEDFAIAHLLVLNAEREIAVFRKSDEYKKLKEIFGIKSQLGHVFINAYGIHHRDFDEMSFSIGGHPTAALLPILLAFKKKEKTEIFLQLLKLEIALGKVLNPELYRGQYHPTTIIGLLGSTALSARLLELTRSQIMNALGIAFSFFSGLKGNFGSSAKCLQVAHAAQQGFLSAVYSKKGFTSNIDLLEQNNALYLFVGKKLRTSHVRRLRMLLDSHLSLNDEFLVKRYDVCGSFHNVIDIALRDGSTFLQQVAHIKKVILFMHPERLEHKSISLPKSAMQKKFSPSYLYAYAFLGNNLAAISSSDDVTVRFLVLFQVV